MNHKNKNKVILIVTLLICLFGLVSCWDAFRFIFHPDEGGYFDHIPEELRDGKNYGSINYINTPNGKTKLKDIKKGDKVLSFDGVGLYTNTVTEVIKYGGGRAINRLGAFYLIDQDRYMQVSASDRIYLPNYKLFNGIDEFYDTQQILTLNKGNLKKTSGRLETYDVDTIDQSYQFVLKNTNYNNFFYNDILIYSLLDKFPSSDSKAIIPIRIYDFFVFFNEGINTYQLKYELLLNNSSSFYSLKSLSLGVSNGQGILVEVYPNNPYQDPYYDYNYSNYVNFIPGTKALKNYAKRHTNIMVYDANDNFLYKFTNTIENIITTHSNFTLPLKFSLNHQYYYQFTIDESIFTNAFLGTTNN